MDALVKDLQLGMRALLKRPGSSALSILAFGLGIGLCTTVFSIIYGIYFRGLDVPEANRLVVIYRNNLSEGINRMWPDQHDFYDWREQQTAFEGLAGFSTGTVNLSGSEAPERYDGAFVSANLFDLLRVRPAIGSTFRAGDDAAAAPLTAVIGYDMWQTRFRGDSGVVGSTIRVNGEQATILGVAPPRFQFPENEEVWVPRRDARAENPTRGTGVFQNVFGRLRDGVTEEQALEEMNVIADRLAEAYPATNEGIGVGFMSFVRDSIGTEADPVLAAMQIATFFVLIIACANVANLLLARAAVRTKEAAVRTAIGASQFRVAFPYFAEAIALSLVGALLGIGIAYVGIDLFDRATQGVGKPYFMEFAIDLPILGFVLGVTALTAVVSGIAPALQISRADVNTVLKDENRGSSSLRAGRLSRVLVVSQVGLSCALLVGAGLMVKSIAGLANYEFSFDTENVFTARIGLFATDYPDRDARRRFAQDLEERLGAIPRVQSVAITSDLPIGGSNRRRFAIEGESYPSDRDYPLARQAVISNDFFETFGMNVRRGRKFTDADAAEALPVAIVNQRFAEKYFPDGDPIGRRIREGQSQSEAPWRTIVGVAPNLRMEGFDSPPGDSAGFYTPIRQADVSFMSIALSVTGGNPLGVTSEVREAVRAVDADLPIYFVRDMPEVLHQETWFYNVLGSLFIVFGAAALFLASVGLYGVLAFSVNRRIPELGIRMALGATGPAVRRLILREGGIQLAIGIALGLGVAFAAADMLQFIMYDVQPRDPLVYATITLVIVAVGVAASLVPARRATRVDPMVALRYE